MAAFVLHELGFGRLLALRFIQKALHRGIRTKREGALPGHNGVLGVIRSELRVAEHRVRIGRIRIGPNCAFSIRQRLAGVSRTSQDCRVIRKHGRTLRLEPESALEILLRVRNIAVFELKLAGDEICRGTQDGIAFCLQGAQPILIDFPIPDNFCGEVAFLGEADGCGVEARQITKLLGRAAAGCETTRFHMIHRGLGDPVGVVPNFVLVAIAVLADMIRENLAAIFQMNSIRPETRPSLRQTESQKGDTQPHSGAF